MDKKIIEFVRSKDFKYIDEIGQGGTGRTVLLQDEIIDESFVCKKYSPLYEAHKDLFFDNFVDEIKILHRLYHKNVVRIFNYYLYPDKKTGYILMEYIKGEDIKTHISNNPQLLNDTFVQVISGFTYLEQNKILHRDIRPENILVSEKRTVKIIDFGFGKRINFEEDFDKSVSLNWRYTPPEDFSNKQYDFRTEVYFVGKLFEELIHENSIENFSYRTILNKMIKVDFNERISSFAHVEREILNEENVGIDFTEEEKNTYQVFASGLQSIFKKIEQDAKYETDIDKIISGLENIYQNSMLEDYIQNPNVLSRCFVNGAYYFARPELDLFALKNFIRLLKSVSVDKKRVIINNLWQRLDTINRYEDETDDLPF